MEWLPRLGSRFRVTGSIPHAFLQPLQASPHAACLSAQAQSQLCLLSRLGRSCCSGWHCRSPTCCGMDKTVQDNPELALPIARSHALLGKISGHIAHLCPRPTVLWHLQFLSSSPVCPPAQPQRLKTETGNDFGSTTRTRATATARRDGQHCVLPGFQSQSRSHNNRPAWGDFDSQTGGSRSQQRPCGPRGAKSRDWRPFISDSTLFHLCRRPSSSAVPRLPGSVHDSICSDDSSLEGTRICTVRLPSCVLDLGQDSGWVCEMVN